MIKMISILEVLVFVLILLTNSFIDKNSKMNISFNQIEALAQGETKNCPPQKCNDGGCGSSSCSLGQSYPGGLGSTHSVTAQSGYFACCIKDKWGNISAVSYPNSCCPGY